MQAQQYKFQHYTGDDGLSQLSGDALFQDREGYIWIGTQAGLNRFDSNTFKVYSTRDGLLSDYITHITQDKDGAIWVGTFNGAARLKNGGIRTFTMEQGLEGKEVRALAVDREGTLWCGTNKGLSRFENERFTRVPLGGGRKFRRSMIYLSIIPAGCGSPRTAGFSSGKTAGLKGFTWGPGGLSGWWKTRSAGYGQRAPGR